MSLQQFWQTVEQWHEDFVTFDALLSYDKNDGSFTWRCDSPRRKAGHNAGSVSHGYRTVSIGGKKHYLHRIAWLLSTGHWPDGEIDHINGRRDDNRLSNLRDVPKSWNGENKRTANRNNAVGIRGVTQNGSRWMARITVNGQLQYLGTYDDPQSAHDAYLMAKRQHHKGLTE